MRNKLKINYLTVSIAFKKEGAFIKKI